MKSTTTIKRKKKKKIQRNLQNKSKHQNNKWFSWVTAVRVISLAASHSPPYLLRMSSNTVLIFGSAVGAAQILILSYSCVFLPPVSTAIRTSAFLLWEHSMTFYIFHKNSLPSWSCTFNLQLVQLVERFWVFFLSYTAPGFQLWFYFHLYMGGVPGICSWGFPGGHGFAPVRARCRGDAVAWVTAAPVTQGSWCLKQQEI